MAMFSFRLRRKKLTKLFAIVVVLSSLTTLVSIGNLTMLANPPPPSLNRGTETRVPNKQFMKARKLESFRGNSTYEFMRADIFHISNAVTALDVANMVSYKQNVVKSFGRKLRTPSMGVLTQIPGGFVAHDGSIYDSATVRTAKVGNQFLNQTKETDIITYTSLLTFAHINQETFEEQVLYLLPLLNFTCEFMKTSSTLRILVASHLSADLITHFCLFDNYKFVYMKQNHLFGAENIYFPDFYPKTVSYQRGFIPPNALRYLRYKAPSTKKGDIVLYLRETGPSSLSLENENEVLSAIEASLPKTLSLVIWRASDNDWWENSKTFSQARVVISPYSKSLSNIVFCIPGANVIEIIPDKFGCHEESSKCYAGLSKSLALSHWVMSTHYVKGHTNVLSLSRDTILETLNVILDESEIYERKCDILQSLYEGQHIFSLGQSSAILDDILYRRGCKLLIFGAGSDVDFWLSANSEGTTAFVVENESEFPATEIDTVGHVSRIVANYKTNEADWKQLVNNATSLLQDFPKDLKGTVWDVILIRTTDTSTVGGAIRSGSMKPIYWVTHIIRPGTTVYVHKAEDIIQVAFNMKFLGDSVLWVDGKHGAMAKFEPFLL